MNIARARGRSCTTVSLVVLLLAAGVATAASAAPSCEPSGRSVPARASGSPGGQAFAAELAQLPEGDRDQAIERQWLAGNVPAFLRTLRPVTVRGASRDGSPLRLTLCVMPDYLSIGSDQDFLRMPVGLGTALTVASRLGFILPTRRIVDLVYGAAEVQLSPTPLPPGERMRTVAYLQRHEARVEQQRQRAAFRAGMLTAGHKKDLVLTPRLWRDPGKVAIYGWHRPGGVAIQPLSTVHGARYADYSHGVRMVDQRVWVNDEPRSIFEVLADPVLAPLLSDEGPLPEAAPWVARAVVDAGVVTARQ